MSRRLALLSALVWCACPNGPNPDGGTGGGIGGGSGGGSALTPFAISDLDPMATETSTGDFAAAFDPITQRVGVVYYTSNGTETMQGHPDYALKYVEWKAGSIVVPPEKIRISQQVVGVAIQFEPTTGEPVIGFLGGPEGFVMGQSIFWFQSDAVMARRSGGVWTQTAVATTGDQITCGNRVSDLGFLVGLWPALAFDSTGKLYFGYRDGHNGQFPMQDWAGSDVEVWEGTPPPTTGKCVAAGGNNKDAYGGHLRMVIGAGDQPAVIHDQMFGTADTNGINVLFQRRQADGTWTAPGGTLLSVGNTQSGAVLAYDPTEGYGIAVLDRATNELKYINSVNGVNWSTVDPVFGAGTGGWYPSLAMDPVNHEPAIAFYICSARSNINETSCNTSEDELRITQRVAGNWREVVVDQGGGKTPKLGFFQTGQRVVVYRVPAAVDPASGMTVSNAGALKIAVER